MLEERPSLLPREPNGQVIEAARPEIHRGKGQRKHDVASRNTSALTPPDSWIPFMTERIVAGFNPLQVILFGSWARGDATSRSDIDLLVVLPRVDDKRQVQMDITRALSDMPVGTDIIVTTPGEIKRRGELVGPILRPALKEGKVLYVQPGCRIEAGMTDAEREDEFRRWLRYANEDLLWAESTLDDARNGKASPRQACFCAQQSAEKALKAILVYEQIEFPRTHNVAELRNLLPDTWQAARRQLPDLEMLSSWAVQARYPDSVRDATQAEAELAVEQAHAVCEIVNMEFRSRDVT